MNLNLRARMTVAFLVAIFAGSAHAADLLSVVDDALDRDPTLAASLAASRAAMQAVPKARAALLPHVSGGWARAYNGIVTEDFPTQHYWQSGWTVVLTQPVFDWAKWTAYRQADYVVARQRLQFASVAQQTILNAAQAYFDLLAAGDELARVEDYQRALDAHLALLARAKAAGEATLVDVRDGESSRAQALVQRLDAQTRMQLARTALERITGKPAEALAALPPGGTPALEPADVESWVTQAQTRGYSVQIGELALQIAKLDTERERAARYPSADVQLTHTPAGAAAGYARPTTTTTGMLEVMIPVFSGGEVTAKVNEAMALEDKARNELEAAVRDAGTDARTQWVGVDSGRLRVAALDRLVQQAQAALDATRIGFGAGSRTSLDVLRATDALYASRRDLIRARYDAVLALLRLLAQTSMLDLDEVARINVQLFAAMPTQRVAVRESGAERSARPVGASAGAVQRAASPQIVAAPQIAISGAQAAPRVESNRQGPSAPVLAPPVVESVWPLAPDAAHGPTAANMAAASPGQATNYTPLVP